MKEHEPAEGLAAAKLALQNLNARRGGQATRPTNAALRPSFRPPLPRLARSETSWEVPGTSISAPNQRESGKDFLCFYCQQPGHKASVCPLRKAKVTGACYAPRPKVGPTEDCDPRGQRYKTVTVNGEQVTALLDTGSFMFLVKRTLVPVGSLDYSRQADILCVHSDLHPYPKADATVIIDKQPYLLTVGVAENLPVDAILGWD